MPYPVRLACWEFPRFSGKNVESWLCRCERIFELENTHDDQKVPLAAIHFDGAASVWHENLQFVAGGYRIMADWSFYKRELLKRFGEIEQDEVQRAMNHQFGVLSKQIDEMMAMMESRTHQKEPLRNFDLGDSSMRRSSTSEPFISPVDFAQASVPPRNMPITRSQTFHETTREEIPGDPFSDAELQKDRTGFGNISANEVQLEVTVDTTHSNSQSGFSSCTYELDNHPIVEKYMANSVTSSSDILCTQDVCQKAQVRMPLYLPPAKPPDNFVMEWTSNDADEHCPGPGVGIDIEDQSAATQSSLEMESSISETLGEPGISKEVYWHDFSGIISQNVCGKAQVKPTVDFPPPKPPDVIWSIMYLNLIKDLCKVGNVVAKADGGEFTVKECHFCPALRKAVTIMKKGETVALNVKPQYGLGESFEQPATYIKHDTSISVDEKNLVRVLDGPGFGRNKLAQVLATWIKNKAIVRDFYSDYLFQSWLCADMEMKPVWLERDNILRKLCILVVEFVELRVEKVLHIGVAVSGKYPLPKIILPLEFLRDVVHPRPKTSMIFVVAMIRNALAFDTHSLFQRHGFMYAHNPVISTNYGEGDGGMFHATLSAVSEINKARQVFLTAYGQLQVEYTSIPLEYPTAESYVFLTVLPHLIKRVEVKDFYAEFVVKDEHLCPTWSKNVKTMKTGEEFFASMVVDELFSIGIDDRLNIISIKRVPGGTVRDYFGKALRRTMNAGCIARGATLQCGIISPTSKVRASVILGNDQVQEIKKGLSDGGDKFWGEVCGQISYLVLNPTIWLSNAGINGLVKCNAVDLAYLKFHQMVGVCCYPDKFAYNVLICGVYWSGVVDEALHLVKQMEKYGSIYAVYLVNKHGSEGHSSENYAGYLHFDFHHISNKIVTDLIDITENSNPGAQTLEFKLKYATTKVKMKVWLIRLRFILMVIEPETDHCGMHMGFLLLACNQIHNNNPFFDP